MVSSDSTTFTPTGALRISPQALTSEPQNNLEEQDKRPVGPSVFVNTRFVFDIIFVIRIEVIEVIFFG